MITKSENYAIKHSLMQIRDIYYSVQKRPKSIADSLRFWVSLVLII